MKGKHRMAGYAGVVCVAVIIGVCSLSMADGETRKPAFAGLFYPADAPALKTMIDGYLGETAGKAGKPPGHVYGIIVPHAGYQYSGRIASYGYNQLKEGKYRTVILVGASHQARFKGIAVYPSGTWQTPLGTVSIDEGLARILMGTKDSPQPLPEVFRNEHSLEVQLPFLQSVLKDFRILPLLAGSTGGKDIQRLTDILVKSMERDPEGTLIVVSTDMSHFHPYREAAEMDKSVLKAIGAMNIEELSAGLDKGKYELCGAPAVVALLGASRRLGGSVKILTYGNSGDVTNDRNRVVGYFSAVLTSTVRTGDLDSRQQKTLLAVARKTVEATVKGQPLPSFETNDTLFHEKRGVFVTLTKKGDLRGCIGYVEAVKPLYRAVPEMAVAASSQDPRFAPVGRDEMKDIRIEISVLSPLKRVEEVEAIEVGRHGLVIVRGGRSGLLLPQVAVEHRWNREEFLSQTCAKAGFARGCWKQKETQILAFSAQVFSE